MEHDAAREALLRRKNELLERHTRVTRKTRHRDEPLPQDFAEQAVADTDQGYR